MRFIHIRASEVISATGYQEHTGSCEGIRVSREEARQFGNIKPEEDFYKSMVEILDLASQEVAGSGSTKLVFDSSPKNRSRMSDGGEDKPDLVAFMVRNGPSTGIVSTPTTDNTARELVAAVEFKFNGVTRGAKQCMCYLFALSRHRPASSIQYGIMANRDGFMLLALGLDAQISWPRVCWMDENDEVTDAKIRKLYACVKYIHDEASRSCEPKHPAVPRTVVKSPVIVGIYKAKFDAKQFNLLPIFTGRGNGRKPFVAVAAAGGDHNDTRIFTYAWHESSSYLKEQDFLERLRSAPGVVRIDEQLYMESIQEDYAPEYVSFGRHDTTTTRTQSLLALKTVGHPLSACSSVLEFLEAMYDLLEVLRYLLQEEGVLHRDVSWSNVLIRPQPGGNVRGKTVSECPADGIKHHYRFISDIYNESVSKVRVELVDFDSAFDLKDGKDDLKFATGTSIFMAYDIIYPRPANPNLIRIGWGPYNLSDRVQQAVHAVADYNQKYDDVSEREFWDDFYHRKLEDLRWVDTEFTHGAMHDAESVFWVCLLFFIRKWPKEKTIKDSDLPTLKQTSGSAFARLARRGIDNRDLRTFLKNMPTDRFEEMFYNLLKTIHDYLSEPWYNVTSTGRGEAYEFHLHDLMQRLFLKEIDAIRCC